MSPGLPNSVLVTGAAQRLGRTIALELARAGFDIGVHCHTSLAQAEQTAQDIRALGRRAVVLPADLADEAQARALVGRAIEAFGALRGVVNNASVFRYDAAASFDYASIELHMRTNLGAPVVLARALFEATPPAGGACVVNLLDQKLWNPNPDFFGYSCSKFALEGATRMLALAFAPRVRVVGIAPGITLPSGGQDEAGFAAAHRHTPLGRSSTPADVAHAVRFAIENQALTGTTLIVDGGQHLWPSARDVMFTTGS